MTYNITEVDIENIHEGAAFMNRRTRRYFKRDATELGFDEELLRKDLFRVEFGVNPCVTKFSQDTFYLIERGKLDGTDRDCIKARVGKLGEKPKNYWWLFSADSVSDMIEYGGPKKTA